LNITKIPTRKRFHNNKSRIVLRGLEKDENRITYNSDKTFSVKSGMLDSNGPMNVVKVETSDYENAPKK
jgi:hypothetical protein